MVGSEATSYILRIQRDELERQLYSQRILYVSIKRDWLRNTKLLFMRKAVFIGSGIIEGFVSLDELREDEKKICLEYNCYRPKHHWAARCQSAALRCSSN